eukprot:54758-Eustigmatos_ZCMA.PRE.1
MPTTSRSSPPIRRRSPSALHSATSESRLRSMKEHTVVGGSGGRGRGYGTNVRQGSMLRRWTGLRTRCACSGI